MARPSDPSWHWLFSNQWLCSNSRFSYLVKRALLVLAFCSSELLAVSEIMQTMCNLGSSKALRTVSTQAPQLQLHTKMLNLSYYFEITCYDWLKGNKRRTNSACLAICTRERRTKSHRSGSCRCEAPSHNAWIPSEHLYMKYYDISKTFSTRSIHSEINLAILLLFSSRNDLNSWSFILKILP